MLREIINVTIFVLLIVKGVCGAKETSISATEGDSVVLHTDITDSLTDEWVWWTFGNPEIRLAFIYTPNTPEYDPVEQFRGRLVMDKTGSLTIRNITTEDAGLYKLSVFSKNNRYKTFRISVYARPPVPVIIRIPSNSSDSSSVCEVVCEVENVSDVTLSWYKGKSLISSISVTKLNRSLPLEIHSLNDSYTCVSNNTIKHQDTHLNASQMCQTNSELNLALFIALPIILLLCLTSAILVLKKRSLFCKKCAGEREELYYAEVSIETIMRRENKNPTEEPIYSFLEF